MTEENPKQSATLLNPYLNFNGECEAAFKFYAECLGGEIEAMSTHKDAPSEECSGPEWQGKILHARLRLGDQVLMGSDCPPEYYEAPKGIYVSLLITNAVEAERIYNALAENGTVHMPFQQTFWAFRFGMVVDRFGTPWMVNCEQDG